MDENIPTDAAQKFVPQYSSTTSENSGRDPSRASRGTN
jgi:hypothetical protein